MENSNQYRSPVGDRFARQNEAVILSFDTAGDEEEFFLMEFLKKTGCAKIVVPPKFPFDEKPIIFETIYPGPILTSFSPLPPGPILERY